MCAVAATMLPFTITCFEVFFPPEKRLILTAEDMSSPNWVGPDQE